MSKAVGNGGILRVLTGLSIVILLAGQAKAQSVEEWEMRVCADPGALPFSNQAEEGFENRIAQILADELGAELTYDWYPQGPNMITYRLRAGECDMIIGVPDGTNGLITTITYYRSPYTFVYREDSGFDVETFDDEVLHDLLIAVQNVGIPPHDALLYRDLSENIIDDFLEGQPRFGVERSRAVVDAVVEGDVDLAITWGPVAGYLAQESGVDLVVKPVQPQFEPPLRLQSFPMTMGVRPGDDALRDLLAVAIANRWEEIQEVLSEYGVPVQQTPRPQVGSQQELTNIAFITPTVTGASAIPESLYEVAGQSARNGALLAEGRLPSGRTDDKAQLKLLTASTPTAAAALRAAERMVVNNDVKAIVGGLGDDQAQTLASVAQRAGIPFFNIGSPYIDRDCSDLVFHVAASGEMYMQAISSWHSGLGQQRWFLVHEDGEQWERLARAAPAILEDVVGSTSVPQGKPSYLPELQEIRDSGAQALLLLLGPRDQIAFQAQMVSAGVDLPVARFPDPVTQTREFLAASLYRVGDSAAGHQVMLWETTMQEAGAGELNEAFTSRFGEPMDPSAWAAFQAITIFNEAVERSGGTDADAVVSYLESGEARFDVQKGVETWFSGADHQLRQPLFVAEVDPEATWRNVLSAKLGVASLAGQVPDPREMEEAPVESLERLVSYHGQQCEE